MGLDEFVDWKRKEKDYAFWCQFNKKPSIIPGCPVVACMSLCNNSRTVLHLR